MFDILLKHNNLLCLSYIIFMIIHIAGTSGSGKSTIGFKLYKKFKNKVTVYDLDLVLTQYIIDNKIKIIKGETYERINKNKYQKYIDSLLINKKKHIILVGYNNIQIKKNTYDIFNVYPDHKFYIKIDDEQIIKQKCQRLINIVSKEISTNLINNNKNIIEYMINNFEKSCDLSLVKTIIKKDDNYYKKLKYKFMTPEKLYNKVLTLLKCI